MMTAYGDVGDIEVDLAVWHAKPTGFHFHHRGRSINLPVWLPYSGTASCAGVGGSKDKKYRRTAVLV